MNTEELKIDLKSIFISRRKWNWEHEYAEEEGMINVHDAIKCMDDAIRQAVHNTLAIAGENPFPECDKHEAYYHEFKDTATKNITSLESEILKQILP